MAEKNNALAELVEDLGNIDEGPSPESISKARRIISELAKVSSGHWENICDGPPAYICDAGDLKVGCCIGKCREIAEEGAGDGK